MFDMLRFNMAKFESWVLHVFVLHYAVLRTQWLNPNNIDSSIQVTGSITITFPAITAIWISLFFSHPLLGPESSKVFAAIAILVVIFGVSRITDKIYDQNRLAIQQRGNDIKRNPDAGAWWAAWQLLKIYLPSFVVFALAILIYQRTA